MDTHPKKPAAGTNGVLLSQSLSKDGSLHARYGRQCSVQNKGGGQHVDGWKE